MPSFFSLQIGLSALRAHQRTLETISHNIANVNTEGYSRQEVILTPQWLPPGHRTEQGYFRGAGVNVAGIRRYASAFLAEQIRRESGEKARWEVMNEVMRQVQAIFQEPADEGLATTLDRFWASWKDLSTDPTSLALRTQVQETAQQVAAQIRERYQKLLELGREIARRIQEVIEQINEIAESLAAVDRQVRLGSAVGDVPNDLLDQRDKLLEELGRLVRFSSVTDEDGAGLTVSVGGHLLISEQDVNKIEAVPDPGRPNAVVLRWSDDGSSVRVLGGKLAGLLEAQDVKVPSYLDSLHELASTLINAVNGEHRTGYGLNGATGLDFFAGSDASDIEVDPAILADANNIAAAAAPNAPGDGSRALDIAQLANQPLTSQGATINGFYSTMVALVGMEVRQADAASRNQDVLLGHLRERRDALSGVSLDEEAIKLISAQRAYEAAARVITAMDEMLDQLIRGTGVVGR